MRGKLIGVAGVLIASLSVAAPSPAESGRLVDFSLRLTSGAPDSPTGMSLHALARGDGKPPPLRSAVYTAPAGTRFNTRALAECTASDGEIQVLGSKACPRQSKLTTGTLTAISGFGPPLDPVVGDVHVFNGHNQIIEVITVPGRSIALASDRVTISGSTLTAHPPQAPGGPPDGQMAVKSIDYTIAAHVTGKGSLVTTPSDCPASGQWTSTGTFGFGDGRRETVVSKMPCERARSTGARRPAMKLKVRPRRVLRGNRVRLRLRLTSPALRCVSRARIRLAGQTIRTNRRSGGARMVRFRREGAHRVRATSPGCQRATALVRVLARKPRG